METHSEQFPSERRPDPSLRAEDHVFDEIQASDRSGFANHEGQPNPESPHLDFIILTKSGGRFGLQVKGGQHSLEHGKWYLETKDGREEKPSPLRRTWDAAMSLREDIAEPPGSPVLLHQRRAVVSRHGSGPRHCLRDQAEQRPRPLGDGQPDGPALGHRRERRPQAPNIGAIGPRRRSR